ncbi:MAG: hypothetical protein KGO01_18535 [Burkholderiales bacterium]|nr:hypothetical protein [Burkholderiales bacterium]MDE1927812.1 hypothetical protein [Burkholderiales bacterium]
MKYDIHHPLFQRQRLSLTPGTVFRGAKLFLNGAPAKRSMGKYLVKNDAGEDTPIRIVSNFVDPVPAIKIGTDTVRLLPALKWYEYAWIGIPVLLLFIGGALGAGLGVAAAYSNSRVFRSDRGSAAKYLLTGVTTLGALLLFVILVAVLRTVTQPQQQ